MIREIRLFGDPVLRQTAEPVTEFDAQLRSLVADLRETMYEAGGIGLAAPQVGVGMRVFVYDLDEEGAAAGSLVNPTISEPAGKCREEEGCLSFPDLTEMVERPEQVKVEGFDENGDPVCLVASGMLARCLQHETDHLDGIMFFDRVSPMKRRMLLKKWRKQRD